MILVRQGNKRRVAKSIIPHFPKHDIYIEPFSEAYMSLAENGAAMRITAWLTKDTTERNTLHLQSAVKKQIQYGNIEAA